MLFFNSVISLFLLSISFSHFCLKSSFSYHFFNFICNIFSCCFKNNNAQKCISTCNEIREKYYSIENILYNQLIMENLLKDYKWNNPDLKFIKNIQLIDRLNLIINDNKT